MLFGGKMIKKLLVTIGLTMVIILTTACQSFRLGVGFEPLGADNNAMGFMIGGNSTSVTDGSVYYFHEVPNHTMEDPLPGIGIDIGVMIPITIGRISILPMANFEGRYLLGNLENLSSEDFTENLGLGITFGGGLDLSFTRSMYLRGRILYQPESTSFFGENYGMRYSVALGFRGKNDPVRKRIEREQQRSRPVSPPVSSPPASPPPASSPPPVSSPPASSPPPVSSPPVNPSQPVSPSQPSNSPKSVNPASVTVEFERRVLELTNNERVRRGIPALQWSDTLGRAARAHSEDMARNGFMSHRGSNGSTFDQRIAQAGFNGGYLAENVASGQRTPEEVVNSWMNSPGHRENILNPVYTHLGVGFADNKWTQKFGTPR